MKCKTCQGVYQATTAGGVRYDHACPPLSEPEYTALSAGDKLTYKVGGDRKDKRDERITLDVDGKASGAVSDGKGVE